MKASTGMTVAYQLYSLGYGREDIALILAEGMVEAQDGGVWWPTLDDSDELDAALDACLAREK